MPRARTAPIAMTADLSHLAILLVAPSQQQRYFWTKLLRPMGVEMIMEADGFRSAMSAMRFNPFDFVVVEETVSDVPVINFVLAARRALAADPVEIPFVFLAKSAPRRSYINRAVERGFETVLAKPIAPIDLYKQLLRVPETEEVTDPFANYVPEPSMVQPNGAPSFTPPNMSPAEADDIDIPEEDDKHVDANEKPVVYL